MHETKNVPGTSPVTDNPNPNNSVGMDPNGPGTDTGSGRTGRNATSSSPGREGAGAERTFRCADVGNADCRWETRGRTEDELMPQISQHAREAHGMTSIDDRMRTKIKDAIRTRAA